MIRHLRPALVLVVLFTALTGLALPLGFVGIATAVLPGPAGGSLVTRNGTVVGSSLLGQGFTQDKYLQGRPSATTMQDPAHPDDSTKTVPAPYNAANSSASNAGPTSKALIDRVTADGRTAGATPAAPVPGDMLTTSASGLDPDISPETAARQVARIATARHLPPEQVQAAIAAHTSGRLLGIIGEPRVNVLSANLALDAAQP